MTTLTFQTPEEARAWDMYVSAFGAVCNSPNWIELCVGQADLMLLERRKRMAPEKVEADDDLDGDGLATLDAAIDAAGGAIAKGRNIVRPVKVTKAQRTYARALIAKLLEGMEKPDWFTTDEDCGWDAAISDLRLRVGLEYEV